jgi:arginine utilization protein RocB
VDISKTAIYDLMLDLVKIPSISPGYGETRLAQLIHDKLAEMPYFKEHPDDLYFIPIPDDPFDRKNVFAIVRASNENNRTIILTGHMDVVDTKEARALEHIAFDPEQYTKRISELDLPEEAAQDLKSGKYLFGRGVMDMKAGLAIQMALLSEYSRDPGNLPVNVAFLPVADEENNSAGMRAAISHLAKLQDQGMEFVACVNSEGVIPKYPGDTTRYVDVGTIGKIMPFFYCVGRESHVGQYYAGFNANLLASCVSMVLEANPEWAEVWKDEVYPPPASLKQKDLREAYSVTLPARAVTYFNHLTVTSTPLEILEKAKEVALKAFDMAIAHMVLSAKEFSNKSHAPVLVPWQPRILTWRELFEDVSRTFEGNLDKHMREFIRGLSQKNEMDERDMSLSALDELIRLYPDKNPMIVVGFLPPYYPHRSNMRESDSEKKMIAVIERIIEEAKETFGENLAISEHFASISDLSYAGFQGQKQHLTPLADNTPGWGVIYDIPLNDLLKLDIPVVNLGPAGKDAHKFVERLELDYSLEVVPKLLMSLVEKLA